MEVLLIDTIKFIIKLLDNNKSVDDFKELEKAIDPLLKDKLGDRKELLWKVMYFCSYESMEKKQSYMLARIDFNMNNKEIDSLREWLIDTGLYRAMYNWYWNIKM